MEEHNRRFQLHAYERSNCVRLSAILQALAAAGQPVSTDAVVTAWARRWPDHVGQRGSKAIRARITDGTRYLKAAAIAHRNAEGWWTVDDAGRLKMSADNLEIVIGPDGLSLPPSRWATRPAVPFELRAVQQMLAQRPPVPAAAGV